MMSTPIRTAGDMRGMLAQVLTDLREKRVSPEEANAIAKVAGEITRSLAVEVQTAIHAGIKRPVPGSMVITGDADQQTCAIPQAAQATEPQKNITQIIPDAAGKIWCEQCEMRVSTADAAGCKSKFCTAKVAA